MKHPVSSPNLVWSTLSERGGTNDHLPPVFELAGSGEASGLLPFWMGIYMAERDVVGAFIN